MKRGLKFRVDVLASQFIIQKKNICLHVLSGKKPKVELLYLVHKYIILFRNDISIFNIELLGKNPNKLGASF